MRNSYEIGGADGYNSEDSVKTTVSREGQQPDAALPKDLTPRPIRPSQLRLLQKMPDDQRSVCITNAKQAEYNLAPYLNSTENDLNLRGHALAAADNIGNKLLRAGYHGFSYATATAVALAPGAAFMFKVVHAADKHEHQRVQKRHNLQKEPFTVAESPAEPTSTGQQ